jgi:hypothetical protein
MDKYYIAMIVLPVGAAIFTYGYHLGTRRMSKYVNKKITDVFTDKYGEGIVPETMSISEEPETVIELLNILTEIRQDG